MPVPNPASFRLLVQILAEFLHGAALGLDVLAQFLTGQALDYLLGFENVKGKLFFETSGE
jgi:hypothetical protein